MGKKAKGIAEKMYEDFFVSDNIKDAIMNASTFPPWVDPYATRTLDELNYQIEDRVAEVHNIFHDELEESEYGQRIKWRDY